MTFAPCDHIATCKLQLKGFQTVGFLKHVNYFTNLLQLFNSEIFLKI